MSDGYSSNDLGLRPARELLSMLSSREVSSVELLEHFVERNSRLHDQLNAIVTLDLNRAFETAKSVDDRRAGNLGTGLLEGLPMTIKDAIAVEGVRSTGGAVELRDHVPSRDAEVVSALRSQGAIIFGKTNEFKSLASSKSKIGKRLTCSVISDTSKHSSGLILLLTRA